MQYVSQAEYNDLKKKQEKGMIKYITIYGVLSFGLPLGALLAVVNLGNIKAMVISFVALVLSGVPYGALTWSNLKRSIKAYEEQNKEKQKLGGES